MITASRKQTQPLPHERWQVTWRESITEVTELLRMLGLAHLQQELAPSTHPGFALRVPRGFVARMRCGDPSDPLLLQVLPRTQENLVIPEYTFDAVGDFAARAAAGVLHKYNGRALLITTGACAVHCRYCFRRHFPYAQESAAATQWGDALAYLQSDESISEIILSGGDPLSLATSKLNELTDSLARIPHLRRLRIHTRLPIVLPERVDAQLADWLENLPWPVAIVLHTNHANEVDEHVHSACARLRATGATLLNQSVLLRDVNDSAEALMDLSERLFDAGVLPYYLHQLDRVAGAAHFAVDDGVARDLIATLRAALPGYLVPRLVREVAGHAHKMVL